MNTKELLIRSIEEKASRRTGQLAGELIRTDSKEIVLAELQFERWLADSCRECLQRKSYA